MGKLSAGLVKILLIFQLVSSGLFQTYTPVYAATKDIEPSSAPSEIESLHKAILSREKHPLDPFSLLRQKTNPSHPEVSFKDMFLKIENSSIKERLLTNDFHYKFSAEEANSFQFEFMGFTSHDFFISLSEILAFENFLFFREKSGDVYFIDLNFTRAGKVDLAIFPFPTADKSWELELEEYGIRYGRTAFDRKQLRELSQLYQIAFSSSVNFVDMQRTERHTYIIEELYESFGQNLQQFSKANSSQLQSRDRKAYTRSLQEKLKQQVSSHQKFSSKDTDPLLKDMKDQLQFIQENIEELQKKQQEQQKSEKDIRRLSYRFKKLKLFLSLPRPEGASTYKEALMASAVAVKSRSKNDFLEAFYQMNRFKRFRYASGFTVAMAAGLAFPESTAAFTLESFRILSETMLAIHHKISDIFYLFSEATEKTLRGFNPSVLYDTYVADGRLSKTAAGFASLIELGFYIIGTVHLSVNSVLLIKDMDQLRNKFSSKQNSQIHSDRVEFFSRLKIASRKNDYSITDYFSYLYTHFQFYRNEKVSFLANAAKRFIVAENRDREKNLKLQALAEEKEYNLGHHQFDLEEDREIMKLLDKAAEKDFNHRFSFFSIVQKMKIKISGKDETNVLRIRSIHSAMMHFLFSFSSFTKTQNFFVWLKNQIFIKSHLFFRPQTWVYVLMYPRFVSTILDKTQTLDENGKFYSSSQLPTRLNGGLRAGIIGVRPLHQAMHWASEISYLEFLAPRQKDAKKVALRELEEEVLRMETNLEQSVVDESLKASLRYSQNYRDYLKITKNDIKDGLDPNLFELSTKTRMFFYWYRHHAMERELSLRLYHSVVKNEQLSFSVKNYYKKAYPKSPKISFSEIDQDIYSDAKTKADKAYLSFANIAMESRYLATRTLDQRNAKVKATRIIEVKQGMKNLVSMSRAARSSLTNLVISKPLEILFVFASTAALTDPLLAPIHDVRFSDQAWNYLSRYQMLNGLMYGIVMGLLNHSWFKIQQYARIEKLGGFHNIPTGKLAEKGYWANVYHNLGAPNNSFTQNYTYNMKIVWANFGASIFLYNINQYYWLGRFDLDLFVTGYMVATFNPFIALKMKIENAAELSKDWIIRDIPEKYHTHPLTIKYATAKMIELRFPIDFYLALAHNFQYSLMSSFKSMATPLLGTRSFSRILLGGSLFTEELILNLEEWAKKYPILEKPAQFCRNSLTKGFEASDKL